MTTTKEVYTIKELRDLGYGRNELQRLAHCEDFYRFGHREGTVYKFNLRKLEKYLEIRTRAES